MLRFLQTYFFQIRTDPQVRRKFLITIALIIGISLMISFIVYVNTRDNVVRTATPQLANTARQVSGGDFDVSQGLEQMFGIPVSVTTVISENSGQWAYMNDNYQLVVDGEVVTDSPQVAPRSIYQAGSGIILNSLSQAYLYKDGKTNKFVEKAHSIVPSKITKNDPVRSSEGYMFLLTNQKQVFVFETSDVFTNVSVKQVAQFNLRDNKRFAELRVFNNNPYLVTYSDLSRTGEVDLWQINDTNKFVKSLSLTGVEALSFGKTGFIYTTLNKTPTELSLYQTNVVDYTDNVLGQDSVLDILPRIAQSDIYGSVYADRCTLDSPSSIVCLIKNRKVINTDSKEQDKIMKFDFKTNKIEFLYQGIFLSADKIHFSDNGQPFLIGQENHLLYRLDKSRQ